CRSGQRSCKHCQVSGGKKPDGAQGGERGVVLQFLCLTRRCLRALEFDFSTHDTRTRRAAGAGAVRSKEVSAGVGGDEIGIRAIGPALREGSRAERLKKTRGL